MSGYVRRNTKRPVQFEAELALFCNVATFLPVHILFLSRVLQSL